MPMTSVLLDQLTLDDLQEWYAMAAPGEALWIAVPQMEWHLRLTRRHCGVTWRPPGRHREIPTWLEQTWHRLQKITAGAA